MQIIQQNYQILVPKILNSETKNAIYKNIEQAGRVCYKSEHRITEDSAAEFVKNLVLRGHEAMLEHASMTVKFITDRGISHEIVRHRIASFAQESTRYCNYSQSRFGNELTFIDCRDYIADENASNTEKSQLAYLAWRNACQNAEEYYFTMLKNGAPPEIARSVLPNSVKTEIVVTMNMREWRHFFSLRAVGSNGTPHPQMQDLAGKLLKEIGVFLPELFGDILEAYHESIQS